MNLLTRFLDFLFPKPWTVVATVEAADEVPDQLPRKGAVVVGSAAWPKWLVFDCACGRGHRIMINLDKSRRPSWKIGVDDARRLSVHPSIDHDPKGGPRCHYFITRGQTVWAKDRR